MLYNNATCSERVDLREGHDGRLIGHAVPWMVRGGARFRRGLELRATVKVVLRRADGGYRLGWWSVGEERIVFCRGGSAAASTWPGMARVIGRGGGWAYGGGGILYGEHWHLFGFETHGRGESVELERGEAILMSGGACGRLVLLAVFSKTGEGAVRAKLFLGGL